MFTIELYKNNSELIKVDKDLLPIATIQGSLTDASGLLEPTILLDGDISLINQANYMYIPAFNRYYYIKNPASVVNGLWRVSGKCDVLMSWKAPIREQEAIVAKQENEYNLFLNDGTLMAYSNPHVITKSFPHGFSEGFDYSLTILGG